MFFIAIELFSHAESAEHIETGIYDIDVGIFAFGNRTFAVESAEKACRSCRSHVYNVNCRKFGVEDKLAYHLVHRRGR